VVHEIDSASQAIRYLEGEVPFADRESYPVPDLIVLDLVMSGSSGMDVLGWLKARPQFRDIPVVVLSGFPFSEALARAHELGAQAFFVKPVQTSELTTLLRAFRET
jgi:CheY-like chemotaxis protein